jgi:hypothetical protein
MRYSFMSSFAELRVELSVISGRLSTVLAVTPRITGLGLIRMNDKVNAGRLAGRRSAALIHRCHLHPYTIEPFAAFSDPPVELAGCRPIGHPYVSGWDVLFGGSGTQGGGGFPQPAIHRTCLLASARS